MFLCYEEVVNILFCHRGIDSEFLCINDSLHQPEESGCVESPCHKCDATGLPGHASKENRYSDDIQNNKTIFKELV